MPFNGTWGDPAQQIFQLTIENPYTWDEFRTTIDGVFRQISAVGKPTVLIIDVSHASGFPNGDILGNFNYALNKLPSNVLSSLVVGGPYIITAFVSIFTKLRPKAKQQARFVGSMDEAHQIALQSLSEVSLKAAK